MQILLASVVSILAATAPQPQAPASLLDTAPLTLTFANTVTFDDAVSTLSRLSGVVVEVSATVPEDVRRQPVSPSSALSLRNATMEQVIDTVTRLKGLSFAVVNAKMVFIFKKD